MRFDRCGLDCTVAAATLINKTFDSLSHENRQQTANFTHRVSVEKPARTTNDVIFWIPLLNTVEMVARKETAEIWNGALNQPKAAEKLSLFMMENCPHLTTVNVHFVLCQSYSTTQFPGLQQSDVDSCIEAVLAISCERFFLSTDYAWNGGNLSKDEVSRLEEVKQSLLGLFHGAAQAAGKTYFVMMGHEG